VFEPVVTNPLNLLLNDDDIEENELLKVYLASYDDVNCEEPLIVPDGTALTLPLNVYLVSNEDVN
jgi:hypothetical protein